MRPWHENDDFWRETQTVIFTEERWRAADADAETIVKLCELTPGAAVLDLGCGVGRHSLAFARRGFRVTGVDRTECYLAEARRRSDEAGLAVEWVHQDMREFCRPGAFDLAVNLLTSFGYFEDPRDDQRVLELAHASLRPGGCLVIDLMGREVVARIFRGRDWQEPVPGTQLLEEREIEGDWERLKARWIVVTDDGRKEHRFTLRLYSAAELKALVAAVGFEAARVYGSLTGTAYNQDAERLIAVARKAR